MQEDQIGTEGLGMGRRMTVKRKREAVTRLLRGEDLEFVSRSLGITAAMLTKWREAFLRGGEAALNDRTGDDRDEQIKRLESKLGQMAMDNELLREKIERMENGRPFAGRRSRR